jgi:hypothetical protein
MKGSNYFVIKNPVLSLHKPEKYQFFLGGGVRKHALWSWLVSNGIPPIFK